MPSHWYSYSFELNPNWTHRFSYGSEIWAYQDAVADKYKVKDVIQFSNGVEDLTYLGPQWLIRTTQGQTRRGWVPRCLGRAGYVASDRR